MGLPNGQALVATPKCGGLDRPSLLHSPLCGLLSLDRAMNMQVWLGFGASTFLICLTHGPNMLFSAEPKRWIKVMAPA